MNPSSFAIASSSGLVLHDTAQRPLTDMVAALSCVLGHRHSAITAAFAAAAAAHLGSIHDLAPPDLAASLGEPFSEFADLSLLPSAAQANEWAIRLARTLGENTAGGTSRHRIVTLLGSDHGDTLACRSAGGRVADQASGGPLVAGFRHVAAGDERALDKAVDEHTAAVMLAPVDGNRGGRPLEQAYLQTARRICDEAGALLIIDETGIPPAVRGHWFFHQAAEVHPDILTAGAGWTGGLPGGLVLLDDSVLQRLGELRGALAPASPREPATARAPASQEPAIDSDGLPSGHELGFLLRQAGVLPARDYPVLRALLQATAEAAHELGGPAQADAIAAAWGQGLDELTRGFEFIPEPQLAGLWSVIPLDLPANEVAAAAAKRGLRLIVSGETTLLACPPITLSAAEMTHMLETFQQVLETLERQPIES